MTEPRRWLLDSPPPEIRALLEHARSESAPPGVLEGTLVALGATSVTATAMAGASASASTGAKVSMLSILVKWGGAGLLAGTVVATGAAGVDRVVVSQHAVAASSAAPVLRGVTAANPSPDLPRAAAPQPKLAAVVDAAPVAAAKRASTAAPASTPLAARAKGDAPPLAESVGEPASAAEVALFDSAMSALRAGDAAGAARSLAGYEARFVPAHLEPEVLLLRMTAAEARGDAREATRNAELIVSRYPKSPGVGRAEELLRAASAGTKQ
jgi:hypothetical protein